MKSNNKLRLLKSANQLSNEEQKELIGGSSTEPLSRQQLSSSEVGAYCGSQVGAYC
jgi:hypothetical protein